MKKGQLLLSKKTMKLYVFLEDYDSPPGRIMYIVTPITKSGTYDEDDNHVEDADQMIAVYSKEDIELARILFEKI